MIVNRSQCKGASSARLWITIINDEIDQGLHQCGQKLVISKACETSQSLTTRRTQDRVSINQTILRGLSELDSRMFPKRTFRNDDNGVVMAVLPNTSRTCFDGDAIACLIASKIAMAALTCTAAFLPTFLSYFGNLTESIMSIIR